MAIENEAVSSRENDPQSHTVDVAMADTPDPSIAVPNPYVKAALEGDSSVDDGGTPYESFSSFLSWSRAS